MITSRARRFVAFMAALLVAMAVIAHRRLSPSHDRDWRTEHAVLPEILIEGEIATIRGVRDFDFQSADDFTPRYRERTYRLDEVERVWLVIAPLSGRWRGPAHIFLSFEFADSQFVSISVEARREIGEEYSLLKGAFRRYELMYVIGEERDLIGVRAAVWNVPVYLYPIRSTRARARDLFVHMLGRAASLQTEPRFYNTFTDNCTTNILTAVNAVATTPIPYGLSVLLPGYADRIAYDRGLIDATLPLNELREASLVNERARESLRDPDFSRRIRAN